MTPFAAPTEDILFSLVRVAEASRVAGWDAEISSEVLSHFGRFAEEVIAPLNAPGDAQGARLENGRVRMPDGFDAAYAQLAADGWQGLTAPEAFGGMEASPLLAAGVSEVFSGANHSMQMVCGLVPGAISTLLNFGSEAQKSRWMPKLVSGEALATMCLTEPGAGSDLSAIRTRAVKEDNGWRLDGEKIFISGGDQDLSDQILHLVLARSGSAEDGIRGLSLFLCARQPGAHVTRIEEKMGLHASPTCQMVFDGAEAELIGEEGAGLAAMFTLMNHARLDVGLQGVAHATRAAHVASAYAAERKQGLQADGTPAHLADHADVRRMLDAQEILAIGARAMCHMSLVEIETGANPALAEFLTSLCKVYGSEAGPTAADLGMQILGGYGYLTEYGMEQTWRDSRICAIYEGANGIHTKALVTRGLRPGGGADAFAGFVTNLSGGRVDTDLLNAWLAFVDQLRTEDDPTPKARDFYEATAALFRDAVWRKILSVSDHGSKPERLRDLAGQVVRA